MDSSNDDQPADSFVLLGDQSLDSHGILAELFRRGNLGILANAFLDQTGHALRKEADRLSPVDRSRIPEFRNLQHLNERYHIQKLKHSGLDAALLCIAQLVHYIE
jgi:hypothetical protein